MQVDEPEDGANINVGLMKNYTGGDKINARSLFKEPIEFKPQFKIVLVCNDLPKVPPYDGGVWRRLEVVEFIAKFVDDPKEDYEFARDNNLKDKLEMWKETFMSILLHYYEIYKKEGLTAPDEVTKFTKSFQNDCDIYSDFMSRKLIPFDKEFVRPSDLYREFKMWHQENPVTNRIMSQKEMVTYLEKKLGKKTVTNEIIRGYRLIKNGEESMFGGVEGSPSEPTSLPIQDSDSESEDEEEEEEEEVTSIVEAEQGEYGDF
jgi:phage/plasmid-associated DNA primase